MCVPDISKREARYRPDNRTELKRKQVSLSTIHCCQPSQRPGRWVQFQLFMEPVPNGREAFWQQTSRKPKVELISGLLYLLRRQVKSHSRNENERESFIQEPKGKLSALRLVQTAHSLITDKFVL